MGYVHRLVEQTLLDALETFPIVMLTGPRQSGKTTTLKELLGNSYGYVSLDELDLRALAIEDPRSFLESYPPPSIIDEIQNAPQLLPYIKADADRNRQPGRWVMTGSQQFSSMRNVSESLAGRVAVLTLYPLSLDEMKGELHLERSSSKSYIEYLLSPKDGALNCPTVGEWLLNGGYPELFVNKRVIKRLWFSSYLQTYIDRDVRGNVKNANLNDFERFVRLLAGRSGQEFNYSSISRQIGISVPTVKSWISFLEASSLIYLLYPYHKNYGKRITKSPKCYFMDTGLLSFLVGLQDEEHLLRGPMAGAIFETACIMHFVKRFSSLMDPCSIFFHRSTDGHEVDLLIEIAEDVFPIEIKLSSTLTPRHADGLKTWLSLAALEDSKGLIISTSNRECTLAKNIKNCCYSSL